MSRFSIGEQIRLSRRMATLLGSGMGITDVFRFVGRSMPSKRKKVISRIAEEISHGRLCSEILSREDSFDKSFVHMVAIGEKSGSLESAFGEASTLLEKRQALSRKIYGALVYPGFIACATAGIAVFLVGYIFPKIIPLITNMNIPLPLLTRILIFVSHALVNHWLAISCFSFLALISGFVAWKSIRIVRRAVWILIMTLPLAGNILRSKTIIQVFRPLGLLLAHGEHIPEALVSVAGIIGNDEYAEALRAGAVQVTRGESFSGYISGQMHIFPPIVVDFLETGERSGGIAAACVIISSLYEAEVDETIRHISTIIEPMLMLVMGTVVGGIALSIVLPIYEITSYLSK